MKTLYFEGAGWADADTSKATDVGNCRIRTAFTNNEGKMIYLELQGNGKPQYKSYGKFSGEVLDITLFIDFCFYITDIDGKNDDCNKSRLSFDKTSMKSIDYTKKNIVTWVNKALNCSFDTMETLDNMEGYRVHADNRGYNLMDNHVVNPERTKARNEAYNMIDEIYRKHCQEKYSVISLKAMDNDTITVRCHAKEYDKNLRINALKDGKPRTAIVNIWTKDITYIN